MICKKVTNPQKSSKKAERVSTLVNYLTAPERTNGLEKCILSEAVNFLTDDLESQIAEMTALAQEGIRSKDPIDHWVLSWKSNENPTPEQAREAADIFIKQCGLGGHQYIFGFHKDTDNLHLHIAVNRVHQDTFKVVKINKGFDLEAAHQAIALIEKKQGWSAENNARYKTNEAGQLVIDPATKRPQIFEQGEAKAKKKPTAKAQTMEIQTGEKSAQRIGIEQAAPIIKAATSWRDLHQKMNAAGMAYSKKGSGAIVEIGETLVKASDIDRKASLSALEKRFGIYQPANQNEHKNDPHNRTKLFDNPIRNPYEQDSEPTGFNTLHTLREMPSGNLDAANNQESQELFTKFANLLQPYESPYYQGNLGVRRGGRSHGHEGRASGEIKQPLKANQTGWSDYIQIRDAQKIAKSTETFELRKRHSDEKDKLKEKLKNDRAAILGGSFKGRGQEKNDLQSVLAQGQAIENLELAERHLAERKALQARFKPLPMYRQWQENPQIVGVILLQNEIEQPPKLSKVLKALTRVSDARGHITYSQNGRSIFRDEGRIIQILDLNSDQVIAAALATAQQKFGSFLTLTGSPEFQRNAVRIAVENNLTCRFLDPDLEKLRADLQAAKFAEERAAERTQTPTPLPSPPSNKNREAVPLAPTAAPKAPQPNTIPPVDARPQTLDPAPKAQGANARLKKAVEFAATQALKEKAEAAQLSEIYELAQAASPTLAKHQITQADPAEAATGVVVVGNEQFIAIESGRAKEIKIYELAELVKNLTYDGTAAEGDRFAPGNLIERKNGKDGIRTVVTEKRPELQTKAERDRRSGQGQGG